MSINSNVTDKLNDIVRQLYELVTENEAIPKEIKMALKDLDDGYNSDSTLSEMFIEANRKIGIVSPNEFTSIPVVDSIESYPHPLILISDEQELDAETQNIVKIRRKNGYVTFPVILFSDSFFKLVYGEQFAYNEIIDTFKNASEKTVMVFRCSEFLYLKEYISCVSCISRIYYYRTAVSNMRMILMNEAVQKEKDMNSSDCIASLIAAQRIKAATKLETELEQIDGKFVNQIDECNAEILKIREEFDKKVFEEIAHVEAEGLSPFVVQIGLEYCDLQESIKTFLGLSGINLNYDFLNDELKMLVSETKEAIASNSARLSLIGTFSSGKTTLINTFLGKRDIPLKTSMSHNTAVLMQLFYEKTGNEYYEIIYKDKLKWFVVKPGLTEKKEVNRENESIKILSVKQAEGSYRIRYVTMKSRQERSVTIRITKGKVVERGAILKPNEPFIFSESISSSNVAIAPKAEIDLLIKLVQKSNTCTMRNAENSVADKRRILSVLNAIAKVAKKEERNINYEAFCKELGLKPQLQLSNTISRTVIGQNKVTYPYRFRIVEVECELGMKNEKRMLDRKGWIELCGDPDSALKPEQKKNIFSESPECYMLAEKLQLHINSEFLQYCSLTDTPGLGSITDEHDRTTERYIRDSSGTLLVMIAINSKTCDAKYQDLINNIANIYNNFRKDDKKNVIFVLNCFKSANECIQKKKVDEVIEMLTGEKGYGFNKDNIFVCNLKSALTDKNQKKEMFGRPSYSKFHDFILRETIYSDLNSKYRGLQKRWNVFFADSGYRLQTQISNINSNINNIEQLQEKLQSIINNLNKINTNTYPDYVRKIEDDFQMMYNDIINAYQNNRKVFFKKVRRNAIRDALDNNVFQVLKNCNSELIELIDEYYQRCISDISYYGETQAGAPQINSDNSKIAVLETVHLENVLNRADDETHWYNKSKKNEYFTNEIREIFQEGIDQSIEKARYLCSSYIQKAEEYKNLLLYENQNALANLNNVESMKNYLNSLYDVQKNLNKLKGRFSRIRFV